MTDNTPTTLNCPSCGAPLEVDGKSALVRCKFCKNVAFVPGIATPQGNAPQLALEEIRRLAQSGNMVEAIRQYRTLYGVGLKEAKDAVEALSAGKVASERPIINRAITAEDTSRVLEEVKELLRRGKKIDAIKRYREVHDVGLAQAKDVVDQVEAALTGIPVPPRPEISGTPFYPPSKPAKKSNAGCLVGTFILLLVGGILALVLLLPGGPITDSLIANGPAILVTSPAGAQDVAAAFYNSTDDTYLVGLLDGETGKLAWRAEALTGDSYFDGLAQDDDTIFAASGTNLLAYHKSDGSLEWQAILPDSLNYGDASLLVTNGRVVVSTVDQAIEAYNAATGAQVWSRRINSYDRTLRLIAGSLVVVDYVGDSYDFSLIFLDPLTGNEQRVLTPVCIYDEYNAITIDPDSPLIYDPATNDLIVIPDSYYVCVQRIHLATGNPVWQTIPAENITFSPFGAFPLDTPSSVYFDAGDQLFAVDKTGGALTSLLAVEDYQFLALGVSGDTLLVRAKRTRGTAKFELWGLDTSTSATLWQMDMGTAQPVGPPDEMVGLIDEEESGFAWHMLAGQLVLVQYQAEPHQMVIQTLDMADGSLESERIVELKYVSGTFYSIPNILAWDETRLYFSLDGDIYCLDVTSGEILFRFQ